MKGESPYKDIEIERSELSPGIMPCKPFVGVCRSIRDAICKSEQGLNKGGGGMDLRSALMLLVRIRY